MLPLGYVLKSRIGHTTVTGPATTVHARNNMLRVHDSVDFWPHGDAASLDGWWSQTLSCYCPIRLPQIENFPQRVLDFESTGRLC